MAERIRDGNHGPTDEQGYLDAISHTKYWVATGLKAAITFAGKEELHPFVDEFSGCYGTTCQLYDDVREIRDDARNGYWSLPISIASRKGLDLTSERDLEIAVGRSRKIAHSLTERALALCGDAFPNLRKLVTNIQTVGENIRPE